MTSKQLSTLATFDDIRRCIQVLTDGIAEEEFLKVMQMQEKFRLECITTAQEAQRIQRELDASLQSMADLETKLFQARRLLEVESRARKEAENERDAMERKIMAVAELLQNENNLRNETRDKLAFLHTLPRKKKSMSRALDEKYGNEINSTGSFLSDLSITHSEDDFLDVHSSNAWNKKRTSIQGNNVMSNKKTRLSREAFTKSSARGSNRRRSRAPSVEQQQLNMLEATAERICATTKVTIPQDGNGAIRAESTIETVPALVQSEEEPTSDDKQGIENDEPLLGTPRKMHVNQNTTVADNLNSPVVTQQQFRQSRPHNFASKTFIRAEACVTCQKKIRFGCMGLRCRNCNVRCHLECRYLVDAFCVPQTGTPQGKGAMGCVADYALSFSPKIPPLILHCVNEIESRGLKEVGLYRVSGAEREVKALKERFIRGKNGMPQLANIDVHVLCGCVKDFLRSLREPLIPTALWKDFCNAVQTPNEKDIRKYLEQAIENLPQANRDTLAFLILHFQRIAECREVSMPFENMARVFGPTVVGHSSLDPDQHAMVTEVPIQIMVMLNLLKIPTEYWSKLFQLDHDKENFNNVVATAMETPSKDLLLLYATPSKSTLKKRKFYGTPPYSKN